MKTATASSEGLKTLYYGELTREQQRKVAVFFAGRALHWEFRLHGYLVKTDGTLRYWEWVQGDDFGKLKRI